MTRAQAKRHPAAAWAQCQVFSATEIDCTIAVVLKILDGKCKMSFGEKAAIMEIYDVINTPAVLFDAAALEIIEKARRQPTASDMQRIHEFRVFAESEIPKPVMKQYKARLRDGLFG
jgi:hypothetical protein